MNDPLKEQEEARRERHWDALLRWQLIQETITWAEAQTTVARNTRAHRLAQQAQQNAGTDTQEHTEATPIGQ